MAAMNTLSAKQEKSPGVIETLSAGFDLVNRMVWIALLPMVLDIFLWRGPRLSIAPVAREVLDWYNSAITSQMSQGAGTAVSAETGQQAEQLRQSLEIIANHFNLLTLLAGSGPLLAMLPGVPSLGLVESGGPVTEIAQPVLVFLGFVGLFLLGVLLGCFYLALIAQQVRDGKTDLARLVTRVWRYWLKFIAFVALLFGLSILLGIPAGLLITAISMIMPVAGSGLIILLGLCVELAAVMMVLYLFFLADAIVLSEVGLFKAMRNSLAVVMRNFWSVMVLIGLVFIISYGTEMIWQYLLAEPWGAVAGIVGNAYIASGLIAARMLFYKNKLAAIEKAKNTSVWGVK